MMMDDKRKMAMLIVGKKEDDKGSEMDSDSSDYDDSNMEKDALEYCAKSFMKAVQHEDTDKLLETLEKMIGLLSDKKDESSDED